MSEKAARYDQDGQPIAPGPKFGAATRQRWESKEEREERLATPDSQLEEAMDSILGEVEQAKASYGVADEERIDTLEELDELVGRATWATNAAATKVVADNASSYARAIEAQHEQAFAAAFNGDEGEDPEGHAPDPQAGLKLLDEDDHNVYYTNDDGDVFASEKELEDW